MVRPNQIIESTESSLTFLMFAQSEEQVIRRVLILNFPREFIPKVISGEDLSSFVDDVSLVSTGVVNRYKVSVNINRIFNP